jgi:hypothetical protein
MAIRRSRDPADDKFRVARGRLNTHDDASSGSFDEFAPEPVSRPRA